MILTNINNNHFHLVYYNSTNLDLNFKYNKTLINNKSLNSEEINNNNNLSNTSSINDGTNENTENYIYQNFKLKDLSRSNLNEILEYYNDKDKYGYSYSDIYYYIYTLNKNNKLKGEYSENFLKLYKDSPNLRKFKKKNINEELRILILVLKII